MSVLIDASALHPSTRLALAALEWLENRIRPEKILDLGCGNGLLSLASVQLWDARVIACDISANAVADCTANIASHAPGADISVLRSDGFRHPAIRAEAPYGLIIANLLAQWQVEMAADIDRCLRPDGTLLLSGILSWQEAPLTEALKSLNIHIIHKFNEEAWQCFVACRAEFTEL